MGGIGLVLNLAKDALLAQQYAMDVISHNITNVNTEGYSRQTPILEAKRAAPYGGFLFGRGVELYDIVRNSNDFIEKRLQNAQTDLLAMSEKEIYMDVMETIFNENSGRSLSGQFIDFWNAWNDLTNNPSGQPERNLLAENGTLLAQSFKDLNSDLTKMDQEIDNSIEKGVEEVNQLLTQIADINEQILVIESSGNANDLRDRRNMLVNNLSEYLDLNTYEHDDGNLTVTTGRGYVLVNRADTYLLDFDGSDINWQSSITSEITITDTIQGGKMGGWLDVRDEVLPKYKADLDELAKSTIWEINKGHSQGVGLNAFTSVTGTYSATDSTEEMGTADSGLDFYDKITDGSFKLWLYDESGALVSTTSIPILASTTTLDGLATTITNIDANLTATVSEGKLQIVADNSYTFAFSDDNSNILPALGINTFFRSSSAIDIGVNAAITSDKNNIAAAIINNNVGQPVGATGNTSTGIITTAGPYTGTDDATYEIEIIDPVAETFKWRKDGGAWSAPTAMAGSPALGTEGVTVTFNGTIATDYIGGDTFTINVSESSDTYGAFAPGDNTNALAIADLQYQDMNIKRWSYTRGSNPTSQDVTNATMEDYLHMLVGSIGIESQSNQREREYKEVIRDQMSVTRDNISAVSLDEEMANLIKYQHAYTAAAKLITTSQDMLDAIINAVR